MHACGAAFTCMGLDHQVAEGHPLRMRAQPEMSRNVQKYSKDVYLRASEAQQCRVHSTVVLPLFTSADRKSSLGVVEVVQTQQDMSFSDIVATLAQSLEVGSCCAAPLAAQAGALDLGCSWQSTASLWAAGVRGEGLVTCAWMHTRAGLPAVHMQDAAAARAGEGRVL